MIEVRPLSTLEEFTEAVRLQKEIWGFEDLELLPLRLFVVATKVGGLSWGAFDGQRMIGFCIAIPGLKAGGQTYWHSHMMGVVREHRNSGVGRALKLRQRQDAIARGIDLVEWTFDPLEIKNAYFNIERLGAVVRRYVLNQYGTTTSHLHGGLPTDRCVAEWWISSGRVKALLAGAPLERPRIETRIETPFDIDAIRKRDLARAREIQRRMSDQFVAHFKNGLMVVGVERTERAGVYLLARDEEGR
ncbi:MAG: acetyltransferase [Acidobacteria bacterium]|jgi:predicted GNAT superfamily acetyltransferase|nr:acetyltransferase [Acidobacteriota bacterium]